MFDKVLIILMFAALYFLFCGSVINFLVDGTLIQENHLCFNVGLVFLAIFFVTLVYDLSGIGMMKGYRKFLKYRISIFE